MASDYSLVEVLDNESPDRKVRAFLCARLSAPDQDDPAPASHVLHAPTVRSHDGDFSHFCFPQHCGVVHAFRSRSLKRGFLRMTAVTSRPVQADPDETEAAAHWRRVMAGLRDPIAPVRVGLTYRLGLLLVAAMMIVLPLFYVALIALAGYGVYLYAVHASVMITGSGVRGRGMLLLLILYLAPIIAGVFLVLFMIKPLFARRGQHAHPLTLSRRDEPLLFAFVDRLCEVVGAPRPARIDCDTTVNASASFRDGFGGFLRKDLVLTIGLPLVAGMDLRMFVGVLAHEFGHFAQGTGMRLTYLIRSVNGWFARVVYERDKWDEWLIATSQGSDHWAVSLVVAITRLCVWVTRRILWVLMFVGHGVSSFMLRQMEFDADRYEARVAGSDTFVKSCERLDLLNVAAHAAMNDLGHAWREKRLCDDLPSLIHDRERDMPRQIRQQLAKHAATGKTGWFDTHPATAERIKSARREAAPGIFKLEVPATALFRNFAALSCRATVAFYHEQLGGEVRPEHIIKTETMIASRGKKKESFASLRRYFQDLLDPIRPVFPPPPHDARQKRPPLEQAAERLLEMRSNLMERAESARAAAAEFSRADERLIAVARVRDLRTAGERFSVKEFNLARGDDEELSRIKREATVRKSNAQLLLNELLPDSMVRLRLALSLEPQPKQPAICQPRDEYDLADEPTPGSGDHLEAALRVLATVASDIEWLRQHFIVLGTLLSRCSSDSNREQLVEIVLSRSRATAQDLSKIQAALRDTPYPYDHAEKQISLAKYIVLGVPPHEQVGDVMTAAESALDAYYRLYGRIMSDLASRAEAIESSLGLPPLPEPPEESKD